MQAGARKEDCRRNPSEHVKRGAYRTSPEERQKSMEVSDPGEP